MNDRAIDINNSSGQVYGINDIKQCWHLILNTVKGSDPLRQEFGCGVFDYIDKPITQFSKSYPQIISDLETWESRAAINSVSSTISEKGVIYININGTYAQTGEIITTALSLDSLSVTESGNIKKSYSDSYNQNSYSL